MTLGYKLAIVLAAFVAILTVVVWVAFRERRHGKTIAADDFEAQQASDGRVLVVIFGAIFGGMLLTLLVAWLVFL
jgi:membrane protein implicated in regulation of membrane protease activity